METRKRGINLIRHFKFNDAWAFVFFVLISGSLIGISLYNLFKNNEFKNFGQTSLPRKTTILFAYNIVCMLFLNLLWLLMLTVATKFLIYAGFLCGPVLSLIIFVLSFSQNGMAPKIYGGVSFLLSLLVSIITFYAIRKQIDAICLLVSKGTTIIIQNIFKVFLLYFCAIAIVSVSTFSITLGVNGGEKTNSILNYFNTFVVFWVIVFFAYLYDVFAAALVKNHVIKATGKDDEEKGINVGVKSLVVSFL
ncbi:hypothetical protein EHP00_2521 [Ecytonucleospora hepatopenaei]|uniref:Uncharacterized protein n=1 Tax=Ecytonucleospora hepatopenaei TaxID=646526 RepID=A0A1W0E2H6_9MICR|nr:hypothetical protein EHP00_2521 [Ecytonucleospora hepatopenaei]